MSVFNYFFLLIFLINSQFCYPWHIPWSKTPGKWARVLWPREVVAVHYLQSRRQEPKKQVRQSRSEGVHTLYLTKKNTARAHSTVSTQPVIFKTPAPMVNVLLHLSHPLNSSESFLPKRSIAHLQITFLASSRPNYPHILTTWSLSGFLCCCCC